MLVFFKDSFFLGARALKFKLNQGLYITFIEFEYGSHSSLIDGVFEKTNIGILVIST